MIFLDGDICKSCVFEDGEYGSQCRIKDEQRDIDCPCIECLLKSICADVCPSYNRLLSEIIK
jgi:hypothetical protein